MAKRKQHQDQKERYNGIVYVLKMEIGADVVYKVGTTNRAAVTRALEVAGEMHQILGYIPKTTILAAKSTMFNYQVEADVLKSTEQWQYRLQCEREWSGQSELRKMQECELMKVYEECMAKGHAPVETFQVGW
jgi:hypothetical protein